MIQAKVFHGGGGNNTSWPGPGGGGLSGVIHAGGGYSAGSWPTILDDKVKVDNADTTADYLANKLVEGAGITLSINNPGANESITITNSAEEDYLIKIDGSDTTPDFTANKFFAGTGIQLSIGNPGGNEYIEIKNTLLPGGGVCNGSWPYIPTVFPVITQIFVNGNRTDTYTETGDIETPFKTIQAAIDYGATLASNYIAIYVIPCFYPEQILFSRAAGLAGKYVSLFAQDSIVLVIGQPGDEITLPRTLNIYGLTVQNTCSLGTLYNCNYHIEDCIFNGAVEFQLNDIGIVATYHLVNSLFKSSIDAGQNVSDTVIMEGCTCNAVSYFKGTLLGSNNHFTDNTNNYPGALIMLAGSYGLLDNTIFGASNGTVPALVVSGDLTLYDSAFISNMYGSITVNAGGSLNCYGCTIPEPVPISNAGTFIAYPIEKSIVPVAGVITLSSDADTFDIEIADDVTLNNPPATQINKRIYIRIKNTDILDHNVTLDTAYRFTDDITTLVVVPAGVMVLLEFHFINMSGFVNQWICPLSANFYTVM